MMNSRSAEIEWLFYNSDGSTAQMCGNGMRCFAKYLYDKKYVSTPRVAVRTGAGVIRSEILKKNDVRVNMGIPILEPEKIPFKGDKSLNYVLEVGDASIVVNAVSMGNPHCVVFTDENVNKLATKLGPFLEKHKLFPQATNVEFVKVKSKTEIDIGVYERGCGITLACGTGACASVVASILNNLTDKKVKANLPGGSLFVEWEGISNGIVEPVFLTGPANYTFFGEFVL